MNEERSDRKSPMKRLSWRIDWFRFKTGGKLAIILEDSKLVKENQKLSTCNRLDLETLGC